MLVTLRCEYALRALTVLARQAPDLVKMDALTLEERLPREFAVAILGDLRRAGLVHTRRGWAGGYALAVPAESLSLGDVVRVVDGPVTILPALLPDQMGTPAGAQLARVWAAVSTSVRSLLDHVTIADLVAGRLPDEIERLALGVRVPASDPEPTPVRGAPAGADALLAGP